MFSPNGVRPLGRFPLRTNRPATSNSTKGEAMTPVREWITKTLIREIPIGGVWSDTNGSAFKTLTGVDQDYLNHRWFGFKGKNPDFETTGDDPRFTTCSSFLPRFVSRVCIAGKLPIKIFHGFALEKERGWTPAWLGDAVNGGPQEGDFFQLASGGMTEHVGVIVEIQGSNWSCVAGGAGGRKSKHDGVDRKPLQARPYNVMGWVDVDAYFDGWVAPEGGEVWST
jgi:hypothetical protein